MSGSRGYASSVDDLPPVDGIAVPAGALHFRRTSRIQAPAEVVFAFHERPDALALLQPPWQRTEVLELPESLEVGARARLRVRLAPLVWQTLEAVHVAYDPPRMFADQVVKGPFAFWLHRHVVVPEGPDAADLVDDIRYVLPLGALGRILGAPLARWQLDTLFDFRHRATREACEGGA